MEEKKINTRTKRYTNRRDIRMVRIIKKRGK